MKYIRLPSSSLADELRHIRNQLDLINGALVWLTGAARETYAARRDQLAAQEQALDRILN